jgi:hypothetical protein
VDDGHGGKVSMSVLLAYVFAICKYCNRSRQGSVNVQAPVDHNLIRLSKEALKPATVSQKHMDPRPRTR